MYVIWSNEHRAWWRPNSQGYSKSIEHAGVYSRDDAMGIVEGANAYQHRHQAPNELAVAIVDLSPNLIAALGFDTGDLKQAE
jgi:hypothetical protein